MMAAATKQAAGPREVQTQLSSKSHLKPGNLLQERYQILGLLGVGGFSTVYQARDMRFPTVSRLCAVKEMINQVTDPRLREMAVRSFEREAALLATLDHPALPTVYDYFSEGERSYLVLEYIRGRDLEAILTERGGKLDSKTVLEWALQICEVLSYLHGHQPRPIVFRDVKPSNLMLDSRERIRLIDFGIAKVFQALERGTMVGTEGYAPPEQYRGEATPAVDVYGLGATLHHLLTGQDPRMEAPFSFAERPIHAANPAISPALEAIIMRCLSYKVEDRFRDALAVREALSMVVGPTTSGWVGQMGMPASTLVGGPGVATAVPLTGLVTETTRQPVWVFECGDEIRSGPAVADGLVFAGSYDKYLYALNAQSGQLQWQYKTAGSVATTPAVYKEYVLVGSADKHLYCLRRRNGILVWRLTTGGPIYSSPKAHLDHAFFGSEDSYLYAIQLGNGRLVWKATAHSPVRSSPWVTDERVFVGSEAGYLFCLDLTGQVKWQFQARRAITSSPVVANDMVFLGAMDGLVYALDANSGWAIWRFRTRRPIISTPAVQGETLLIGSSDGHLYALDALSGRQLWLFKTEGQVTSSPAVWQNAVYFGSTDGFIYSLDIRKGEVRWRFQTGGLVVSSPAVANGMVFVGSADKKLYALPV
ncbi:MAG: serine/threonine-protein kinase [Chloroflexota bacterium]